MTLQELEEKRESIVRIVEKHKGEAVRIFGSTVTGNPDDRSDVDLLVLFEENASLFDLISMKNELESLIGTKVDIISEAGLKDNEIGRKIREDAVVL